MAHDVFISYSHVDKNTADAACATLEEAGIRSWIAPRDIPPGAEWAEAIIEAIDASWILVLIFSSNSNASRQVSREVQRALERSVTIMPVRIDQVEPERALAYYLSGVHWLDALTPPIERHLQELSQSINALLAARRSASDLHDDPRHRLETRGRIGGKRYVARSWVLALGTIFLMLSGAYAIYRFGPSGEDRCYLYDIGYDALTSSDRARDCQHGNVIGFSWVPAVANDLPAMLIKSTVLLHAYHGQPKRWQQVYLPANGQLPKNPDGSPYISFNFDIDDPDVELNFRTGSCETGFFQSKKPGIETRRGFTLLSDPRAGVTKALSGQEQDVCNAADFRDPKAQGCGWGRLEIFVPSEQPDALCPPTSPPNTRNRRIDLKSQTALCMRGVDMDGKVLSDEKWGTFATIKSVWCD